MFGRPAALARLASSADGRDSRGPWEGETIIVERTNFRDTIGPVVIGGRTGPTRSNGATERNLAHLHKPWSGLQNKTQGKTMTVRVFGDGSLRPALSVTVRVATNVPGVEYVTLPGVATLLDPGLPPGNDQEYPVTVPSGSVPDPEKNTDRPAKMITYPEGLSIDPVGGTFAGPSDPSA